MKCLPRRDWIYALLFFGFFSVEGVLRAQPSGPVEQDSMLTLLERMLADDPSRADTWRLVGRIHRQQNRIPEAVDSFSRALQLQPDNVAAHADLGELLDQVGDWQRAAFHFDQVMLLAPSSNYAQQLVERGLRTPRSQVANDSSEMPRMLPAHVTIPKLVPGAAMETDSPQFQGTGVPTTNLASFEVQTFDGADDLERGLHYLESDRYNATRRWRAFIEFGALYNTNVSLTPISRELSDTDAASYQAFLSPDLEWSAVAIGPWRSGPLLRGYLTLNEDEFQAFNLASFQPGVFTEKDLQWRDQTVVGRAEYVYAVDLMDGDRFGDRHAVTASLTMILENADVLYSYFTTSYSQFTEDGANPAIDSLDGLALTLGISRFYQTGWARFPTWSLGADLERADTEGDDYRYEAINLHSDATLSLTERLSLVPRVGVGYRNYGDFTGVVSRDELTYRLGAKLRWWWNEVFSISAVVGHDRFASDNEDFDSQRTEAGIVANVIF